MTKTTHFGILVLQLIIGTSLFATGCKNADAEAGSAQSTAAKTIVVERGTLVRRLGYTGDIEGRSEIRIFSPIPDRIVSLPAREGERVKKDQILAVVRSGTLTEGVRQAAGGLDAARAQRSSLQDQVERLNQLRGSGAVTSSQILTVENQLAAADAQVRQLEAMLGQAKQRKGDAVIRAPISGVIGQVFVKAGDMAAPQIPICTVVDMDEVRIKVRIPESDLLSLKPGQPVVFSVAASESPTQRAQVSRVSPVLDRLSRTATMEIDVENSNHLLKPGMLARVEVEVEHREDVVWAPMDALTVTAERRGEANLYRAIVAEGGVARERKVLLGLVDGARAEIIEGLKAGEKLVTQGQHMLADGDPVRENAAADAGEEEKMRKTGEQQSPKPAAEPDTGTGG